MASHVSGIIAEAVDLGILYKYSKDW